MGLAFLARCPSVRDDGVRSQIGNLSTHILLDKFIYYYILVFFGRCTEFTGQVNEWCEPLSEESIW